MTHKTCARCRRTKPLPDFNRYTRSPDGHQPHCRDCSKAYYRQNRATHLANVNRTRLARQRYVQGCHRRRTAVDFDWYTLRGEELQRELPPTLLDLDDGSPM